MEMDSRYDTARQRFDETREQMNDAASRISSHAHETSENVKNTARNIQEINTEYFNDITFNYRDLFKFPSLITTAGNIGAVVAARDLSSKSHIGILAGAYAADIVDGWAAKQFDQESDAGALYDATSDKTKNLLVGAAAWKQGVVSKELLGAFFAKEFAHVALTGIAKVRHNKASLRPPQSAKKAMFASQVSIAAFMTANAISTDNPESHVAKGLRVAGYGGIAVASFFEAKALKTYYNRTKLDGVAELDSVKLD